MITTTLENFCVSCEHCVNCGRRDDVLVPDELICDECGDVAEELFYDDTDGQQLCVECATKKYFKKITWDNASEYIDNELDDEP